MTHALHTAGLIFASLVVFSGCVSAAPSPTEDIAVLSAILTNRCEYAASHAGKKYELLSAQALFVDHVTSSSKLDSSAMNSLLLRNKTAHDLPTLSLCPGYKSVPQVEIEAAMAKKGWPGFYKAFPNASGISYLSLPGYSLDGNVAIVEFSGSCNLRCGSSFFWVMHKVEGKWTLYKVVPGWIS
ncbi:hypothetical protein [Rhodanobacter sp. C03]|uniref:hypothetical protein n=1 Tax=Rhodanobacter sp. C03 TaxID=1945858 RepID=UPI0009870D76|nr:hypothetical protein [Rhodanobacter sp. C03]OOG59272.1 hypothetical protein B0E48_00020 [Rhodanobacter sp. C03]